MSKSLYLSATGIMDFFTCPMKFKFRQEWSVKEPQDNLGLIVHRAMEKQEKPEGIQAKTFYTQLNNLLMLERIQITSREKREQFPLLGTTFTRVVDVVGKWGTRNNLPIILDYKTADWPWFELFGHTPQSRGIQAAAYLYPAPKARQWPNTIIFLVVNKHGQPQLYNYRCTADDFSNLKQSIQLIKIASENDLFPYNRGKSCKYCDWADICFKAHGWRSKYTKRGQEDG